MTNQYSEECVKIEQNMIEFLKSEKDCFKFVEYTKQQIEAYKNIIQSFFVGKKSEIQKIYQVLKEKRLPYNKINFIDINLATHMYGEYFQGLVQFISKITDLRDTDEISEDKMISAIIHVETKDLEFRDSIIGGSRNEMSTVDLDNAMINIESLINIYNEFDEFQKCFDVLIQNIKNNNCEKYYNTIRTGMRVFIMSIIHYISSSVDEILSTYEKIIKSMEHRTPASGEKKVPEFQLF